MKNITSTESQFELFLSSGDPALPQPEFLGFKINQTGLVITDEEMPIEKWRRGLKTFRLLRGKIDVAQADYIQWGRLKYGKEAVEQELGQLEFPMPEVNAGIAIANVPALIRHENLRAEHYVILGRADLTEKHMAKWAKKASEQKLSPAQLKASINAGEVVSGATADQQMHGIISLKGTTQEFCIWVSRMGGAKGLLKKEPEVIAEIIEDLEPFVSLYYELKAAKPAKAAKKPSKKATKKPAKKKAR